MYKNLRNIFICSFFIATISLIGSNVFALTFSQAMSQSNATTTKISDLFQGKAGVSNLYNKSLKLVQSNVIGATQSSLDQLKIYYQSCSISTQDLLNILYVSDSAFAQSFKQIISHQKINASVNAPTQAEIDKSYGIFFACKKISSPSTDDYLQLNKEISTLYADRYTNKLMLSSMTQTNFGEDFFRNGTLEDSPFDLLYDIQQVGNVMFEGFKEMPAVLFYQLPQVGGSSATNISPFGMIGNPLLLATTLNISALSGQTAIDKKLLATTLGSDVDGLDEDTTRFVETANSSAGASSSSLGNMCIVPSNQDTGTTETKTMTNAAYISGIESFIKDANSNDVVDAHLLEVFTAENPAPAVADTPQGNSDAQAAYASAIANTYAEKAFGSSVAGCEGLDIDKGLQCELAKTKSCVQKCNDLTSLTDKAICISDCTCFLVSGPQGAGWEKVEDMYKIKFCKVPVQKTTVDKRKTVSTIEAIFQAIEGTLQGLKDSGQTVKKYKPKEYYDSTVKMNLADNMAFKIILQLKALWPQKSVDTLVKEQKKEDSNFSLAYLGMNIDAPDADDPNRYLVISSVQDNTEDLSSLQSENEQLVQSKTDSQLLTNAMIANVNKMYASQKNVLMMQEIITFLADNQMFRGALRQDLWDMNIAAADLKAKIEESK